MKLLYSILFFITFLSTFSTATISKGYCNKSSTATVKGWSLHIPTINDDYRCILKSGRSNKKPPVKAIQTDLNKCYGRKLAVDGIYGSKTKAAVKYAQGQAKTRKDGVYGPDTANAIKWYGTKGGKGSCKTAKQWSKL